MNDFLNKYLFVVFIAVASTTALFAQTEEGVYATSLEPLTNAAYKIVFVAETEIPANAEINIIFPPQANLSRVLHAGSGIIPGRFETTVVQDTLKAKRTGNGENVPPQLVDLIVAMIINPSEMNRNYVFKAIIKTDDEVLAEKEISGQVRLLEKRQ